MYLKIIVYVYFDTGKINYRTHCFLLKDGLFELLIMTGPILPEELQCLSADKCSYMIYTLIKYLY